MTNLERDPATPAWIEPPCRGLTVTPCGRRAPRYREVVNDEGSAELSAGLSAVERVLAGKESYDALAPDEQAAVRTEWSRRISDLLAGLDLSAELLPPTSTPGEPEGTKGTG